MLQLQISQFNRGTYISVEGKSDSDHFYIIQQGFVQCTKTSSSGITPIKFGPGDFVGVVSCMAGKTQVETAIALTDVVAISVKKEQYPDLIVNNNPVALKIIKTFAKKMRLMNEMLTKIALNSIVQNSYEQIFNNAQYYEKCKQLNIAVYGYYQYLKTKPTGPNAEIAKRKFIELKQKTNAVYFEPTNEAIRSYPKDTMIFSDFQRGADMFIIQQGEVAITKIVDGKEITLALLGRGDMFGEMALLENKPRSANAIAHSDCSLMVVNIHNFNLMVSTQPQMIAKLTTTLAERLWSMYRQIDNAAIQDPVNKMIDMLALQMEKSKVSIHTNSQYQTTITPQDLATMCGLSQNQQYKAIYDFQNWQNIKLVDNKIFIKDLYELSKQSAFLRKQSQEVQKDLR